MAAVKITINGVICDMYGRTISGPVKIVGEAMYSGVGIGGGPMPPGQGGGGGAPVDPGYGYPETPVDPGYGIPAPPLGTWGPNDPRPTPPIALPPYVPGGPPVQIWPSPGHPAHPIVIPEPPPPTQGGGDKPPPAGQAGWGYVSQWDNGAPGGWGFFPASSDKPNPAPIPGEPPAKPV